MSGLDRELLAERSMAVQRHLARVAARLPDSAEAFTPSSDASDAVILHLWQATQIVIDLAVAACARLNLGSPASYADAFRRLRDGGVIPGELADRLIRAAGFRNVVAHAYEDLDLRRIWHTGREGPPDLHAFLRHLRDRLESSRQ